MTAVFTMLRKKYGIKKLMLALLAISLLGMPVKGEAKVKAPKMQCHAYAVMDAGSGEILFGQEENKVIYPASTAKLMAAIVCVEHGDTESKIKTKSKIVNGTTYGTYNLGIASGVKFSFKDLLHMSLISSAADATDSLAEGVFGSKKACAEAMNAKCAQMGLTQTSFDNPVGSDIGAGFNETYSTAAEMAEICRYAMTVPLIRSAVAKAHYDVTTGQDISVNTTNWFLRGMAYYNRDKYKIIGSKSGTTNAAGNVFIATAVDDKGHEVICAYFGNVSKESTFSSIRKLLDYTFEKAEKGKLELTSSHYDVRCSSELGDVYDEYASLHCYPEGQDGLFHEDKEITRKELAKLLRGVNNLKGNAVLDAFVKDNTKGKVTAAKFASLVNELYPNHLPDKEIKEWMTACINTENLTKEEQEAFAVLQKYDLSSDGSFRNAKQKITRKQALLMADKLADYQMKYYAAHSVYTENILPQENVPKLTYQALSQGNMLTGLNKKWIEYLTNQAAVREAEEIVSEQAAQ